MNSFKYQLVLVTDPGLEKKDREELMDKISSLLGKEEAKIKEQENMGLKDLAYPIRKLAKGDYWRLTMEAAKKIRLSELNLFLNRDKNVIRYLILKE